MSPRSEYKIKSFFHRTTRWQIAGVVACYLGAGVLWWFGHSKLAILPLMIAFAWGAFLLPGGGTSDIHGASDST